MLKRSLLVAAPLCLAFTAGFYAHQAASQAPAPAVKRTPLGKVEVPGSNYEVVFGMAELPAAFKAGRHSHPGPVLAYVLDGEFVLALDGQPEKTFKTGEALQVPDKAVHDEGAGGGKPAKLIAVYVVEKGKPLVAPVK
jgi:quercetin dioxygenase-like cupin family protein